MNRRRPIVVVVDGDPAAEVLELAARLAVKYTTGVVTIDVDVARRHAAAGSAVVAIGTGQAVRVWPPEPVARPP